MNEDDETALGRQLQDMLRRQAARREAPEWIQRLCAGEAGDATVVEESDARAVVTRPDGDRCEIEVRVTFPAPRPVGVEPWQPRGLGLSKDELAKLYYVVVDEIVDDDADVSVTRWPEVDDRGRLVFSDAPVLGVRTSVEALSAYLDGIGVRRGRHSKPLRMGSAFAAVVRTERLSAGAGDTLPPEKWLLPPVYDISTRARDRAKASFYAAVTPTLRPAEVKAIKKGPAT